LLFSSTSRFALAIIDKIQDQAERTSTPASYPNASQKYNKGNSGGSYKEILLYSIHP
jgi:hypothetical protein